MVIENIPFVGLIPALKSGKIDLILSSLSVTEQRKESIAFSDPYLQTGLCLLVGISSSIQGIGDVDRKGCRVVVKQGTTGQVYALNHLLLADVHVLDKESTCVLEVAQGKADAFIYDQFSVAAQWKKHRSTTRALLTPFVVEYWAIGLRKEDTELLQQVNAFLKEFRAAGKLDQLTQKFLKEK